MPVIIGIDEAGYGPNLGPLMVAATIWEVPAQTDGAMLYKLLRKIVVTTVEKASRKRIAWADSKAVYKSGSGFEHLERGVLAALALCNSTPRYWNELWQVTHWQASAMAPQCSTLHTQAMFPPSTSMSEDTVAELSPIDDLPWHSGYTAAVPTCCKHEAICEIAEILAAGMAAAGVRLIDIIARPVFPAEYNTLIDQLGNKSDALSVATLELVARALQSTAGGPVEVYCDKHGGRNRYHAHLQTQFEDAWIEVRVESDAKSLYRFQAESAAVEIGFWTNGEQFLPVALASMTAKYLREIAMQAFNHFWCSKITDLQPTAGYPNDSRRFKSQIADLQQQLNIADHILWRVR